MTSSSLAVHFSSGRQDWATPQSLFDAISAEYGPFDLDVCATPENAKAARYFTPEDDGLKQRWSGRCWMNPPYGSSIRDWVARAYDEALESRATTVGLLPARTDTNWWYDWVRPATEIVYLKGRVRFEGATSGAPFPSALAIWRRRGWADLSKGSARTTREGEVGR